MGGFKEWADGWMGGFKFVHGGRGSRYGGGIGLALS
jgi:hypothetical protein